MSENSIFDDLEAIRLSPDAAATAGTQEVLRHVPIRKPSRHEFFRVHPDAEMQLATGVFEDKVEREVFFVTPDLRSELAGELKPVLLATTISRQGVSFLWPVPLPDESGRRNAWAETARDFAPHWLTQQRTKPGEAPGGDRAEFGGMATERVD